MTVDLLGYLYTSEIQIQKELIKLRKNFQVNLYKDTTPTIVEILKNIVVIYNSNFF